MKSLVGMWRRCCTGGWRTTEVEGGHVRKAGRLCGWQRRVRKFFVVMNRPSAGRSMGRGRGRGCDEGICGEGRGVGEVARIEGIHLEA